MKLRSALLVLCLGATAAIIPHGADAANQQISNLSENASLSKQDVLTVKELITDNSGAAGSQSITHDIPLSYQDDQGNLFPVSFRLIGSNATATVNSTVAEVTVAPEKAGSDLYSLQYTLTPIVLVGQPNDVLKYSATGLGWSVPVMEASLTLVTPTPPAGLTCTTGTGGNTTANCRMTQTGNTSVIVTDATLPPGANLTISCDFPPGSFTYYLHAASELGLLLVIAGTAILALGLAIGIAVWLALRRNAKNLPIE